MMRFSDFSIPVHTIEAVKNAVRRQEHRHLSKQEALANFHTIAQVDDCLAVLKNITSVPLTDGNYQVLDKEYRGVADVYLLPRSEVVRLQEAGYTFSPLKRQSPRPSKRDAEYKI